MTTTRTALPLARLSCASTERFTVERILRDTPGVLDVYVNPVTEMAYVEYDPTDTEPDALFRVLGRAGFAPADRVAVRRPRPTDGQSHPTW